MPALSMGIGGAVEQQPWKNSKKSLVVIIVATMACFPLFLMVNNRVAYHTVKQRLISNTRIIASSAPHWSGPPAVYGHLSRNVGSTTSHTAASTSQDTYFTFQAYGMLLAIASIGVWGFRRHRRHMKSEWNSDADFQAAMFAAAGRKLRAARTKERRGTGAVATNSAEGHLHVIFRNDESGVSRNCGSPLLTWEAEEDACADSRLSVKVEEAILKTSAKPRTLVGCTFLMLGTHSNLRRWQDVVRALGGEVTRTLVRGTTHVVCGADTDEDSVPFRRAREWGLMFVTPAFLDYVERHEVPPDDCNFEFDYFLSKRRKKEPRATRPRSRPVSALLSGCTFLLLGTPTTRTQKEWWRLIHSLGGKVVRSMPSGVSHVVCLQRPEGNCFYRVARCCSVPMVTEEFLLHVERFGALPSPADYPHIPTVPASRAMAAAGPPLAMFAAAGKRRVVVQRKRKSAAEPDDGAAELAAHYDALLREEAAEDAAELAKEDEELIKKYESIIFSEDEADDYEELRLLGEEEDQDAEAVAEESSEEDDPFALDTPRKRQPKPRPSRPPRQVRVVVEKNKCAACGCQFQNKNPNAPGYLPPDVYDRVYVPDLDAGWLVRDEVEAMIAEAEEELKRERRQRQQPAEDAPPAAAEPGDAVLQPNSLSSTEGSVAHADGSGEAQLEGAGAEEGEDSAEDPQEEGPEKVVCQRCHTMRHKLKELKNELRSGWSENDLLQPERFRQLLTPLRKLNCCVVMFVDLFDFHGSMLRDLFDIVGFNPLIIVANKVDLLPSDADLHRIRLWVWVECKRLQLRQLTLDDIYLVSCKSGLGISALLKGMKEKAKQRPTYIVGAANVGKSSFINALVSPPRESPDAKRRPGAATALPQLVTSSLIPGTTLDFLKIELKDSVLYDTPGIVMPHQLTSVLTVREMEAVIPSKRVKPVTLRVQTGQCVLLGAGLAQVELLEGRPMLFTFFVSPAVTLHPCKPDRVPELLARHAGAMLAPPFTAQRAEELRLDTRSLDFPLECEGREKPAAVDITIGGLGWLTVTGWGECVVRVTVPRGIQLRKRPALLPFEGRDAHRFTGTELVPPKKRRRPGRD